MEIKQDLDWLQLTRLLKFIASEDNKVTAADFKTLKLSSDWKRSGVAFVKEIALSMPNPASPGRTQFTITIGLNELNIELRGGQVLNRNAPTSFVTRLLEAIGDQAPRQDT